MQNQFKSHQTITDYAEPNQIMQYQLIDHYEPSQITQNQLRSYRTNTDRAEPTQIMQN